MRPIHTLCRDGISFALDVSIQLGHFGLAQYLGGLSSKWSPSLVMGVWALESASFRESGTLEDRCTDVTGFCHSASSTGDAQRVVEP